MDARSPASLEVRGLTYRYPGAQEPALHDVTFSVAAGERIGLLGPNGAGKTTAMRLVCGYLPIPPQTGPVGPVVRVAGHDARSDSLTVRRLVGYLPEQVPLYRELRVQEHLAFRAIVKGVRRKGVDAEIRRVSEMTGLEAMLDTPVNRLSRGYRQRVGIADALLGRPPLLVLDEPTVGLDPNQVQGIRSMLRELGGAHTLIFSSHVLPEVEALCDRIIVLSRGRVVADETVHDALSDADTMIVEWVCEVAVARGIVDAAVTATHLPATPHCDYVHEAERTRVSIDAGGVELARAIGQASLDAQVVMVRLEPGRRRLEEHFARVTGAIGVERA
ncbi:MAG: ABC transporter ATP-binding protein [Myxococcales bacterium FL481]|nr:MAG: ABC transporter ATP-binding protein [Myxococcales bacterium FL481]